MAQRWLRISRGESPLDPEGPDAVGPTYGTGATWEVFYEPPALDIEQIWSVHDGAPKMDKDGYMQLPDAPGLGVSIKPDLLQDA